MDLDGDGHRDLITGSWPGELYLFKGKADGGFADKTKLLDKDGKDVHIGKASAVYATDWDKDGDVDLVVGCIDGYVWFVPNESGNKELKFGAAAKVEVEGSAIHAHHSAPVVADWDKNGTLDLIVGQGDGGVALYANSARAGAPKLAAASYLVEKSEGRPDGSACGHRVKPHVTDWNGDGRLDLLLGDFSMGKPKQLDLTDEQKETLARLQQERKDILEEITPIHQALAKKVLADLGIDVEDETAMREAFGKLTDEQRKAYGEALGEAIQKDEKIVELQGRLQKLYNEMRPLQPSAPVQGNVWVMLRSAAPAPTTVGGG